MDGAAAFVVGCVGAGALVVSSGFAVGVAPAALVVTLGMPAPLVGCTVVGLGGVGFPFWKSKLIQNSSFCYSFNKLTNTGVHGKVSKSLKKFNFFKPARNFFHPKISAIQSKANLKSSSCCYVFRFLDAVLTTTCVAIIL